MYWMEFAEMIAVYTQTLCQLVRYCTITGLQSHLIRDPAVLSQTMTYTAGQDIKG